jgi:uncharacterized DUF497 family protein
MGLTFEWDQRKARANVRVHRVTFGEASTVFGDPLSLTIPDVEHSGSEDRFVTIGRARSGRLVVVSHTEQGDTIRIISARVATRRERATYEQT